MYMETNAVDPAVFGKSAEGTVESPTRRKQRSEVVPELQDFPSNLREGIDELFGFARLELDTLKVKDASADALLECGEVAAVACAPIVLNPNDVMMYSDQGGNLEKIRLAFQSSLATVEKVTNDKYLGTENLRAAGDELKVMDAGLQSLQDELSSDGPVPCQSVKEAYCELYTSSKNLAADVAAVTAELDRWTDSDLVHKYEESAGYMIYLHALPYIMVLGALAFFCVWWKDGRCCAGKSTTCCALIFGICWFVFFIIQTVLTALCVGAVNGQDKVPVKVLDGEPTLEEVLNHVKVTYPEFWSIVFQDMEGGLITFYHASLVFEVFAIFIFVFACGICCYTPYNVKQEEEWKLAGERE